MFGNSSFLSAFQRSRVVTWSVKEVGTGITKLNKCGSGRQVTKDRCGATGLGRIDRQAEENCLREQWQDTYPRGSRWWNVEVLHRRLPRHQSGPRSSAGDEPAVHCLCVHAPHLGEVHTLLNKAWLRYTQSCCKIPSAAAPWDHCLDCCSVIIRQRLCTLNQYTCEGLPTSCAAISSSRMTHLHCYVSWQLEADC